MEYRPGRQNAATDALSRPTEDQPNIHVVFTPHFDIFYSLRQDLSSRQDMVQQRAAILAGDVAPGWSVVDDLLLFHERVFVLADCEVWAATLVADTHNSGHEGTQKTLHRLRSQFHELPCANWSKSLCAVVRPVSATSPSICILLTFFSHCKFHIRVGMIFLWTSWNDFPRYMASLVLTVVD